MSFLTFELIEFAAKIYQKNTLQRHLLKVKESTAIQVTNSA